MLKFSKWLVSVGLLSPGILLGMISAPTKQSPSNITPEQQAPLQNEYVAPSSTSSNSSPCVFVSAEALYWKVHFIPLFTFKQTITDKNGGNFSNYKGKNPHSHWDWGFRVGVGFLPPIDHWEVGLNWTHIHFEAIGNAHANASKGEVLTIFSPNSSTRPVAQDAREKISFIVNVADLMLSREFVLTPKVVFKPGIGMKYFRLGAEQNTVFRNVTLAGDSIPDELFKIKNDFWGLGPAGHLNLRWYFGWDFNVFGDFGVSFLYGQYDLRQTSLAANATQGVRGTVPSIDGNLGLSWDRQFKNGKYRLGFQVSWEHHVYFQILQPDLVGTFDANGGDLSTDGVTGGLRLDF